MTGIKNNHGGTRQKKPSNKGPWTHPDAEGAFDAFIAQSRNTILGEQVNEKYKEEEEEEEEEADTYLTRDQVDASDSDDDESIFNGTFGGRDASDGSNFCGSPLMLSLFAGSCKAFW